MTVLERRAICETCGHTREWHDRDAVKARMRDELPIDRPCYREVGGAACRCGGFRDSGEIAAAAGAARQTRGSNRVLLNSLLTLALVIMGLALLYAYRSQTPSVPSVPLTQAIEDVQAGRVRAVTIVGDQATLELHNLTQKRTTLPQPDQVFVQAVTDYNDSNPAQRVELRYMNESQPLSVVGSIVLSLLPLFLIGGFLFYLMRSRMRG